MKRIWLAALVLMAWTPGWAWAGNFPVDDRSLPGCGEFALCLADRVFFDSGDDRLGDGALADVREWAIWLKAHGGAFLSLEGHCSADEDRGDCLVLAGQRVDAVREELLRNGVPPKRLVTRSFDASRPANFGQDERSWRENRRVTALQVSGDYAYRPAEVSLTDDGRTLITMEGSSAAPVVGVELPDDGRPLIIAVGSDVASVVSELPLGPNGDDAYMERLLKLVGLLTDRECSSALGESWRVENNALYLDTLRLHHCDGSVEDVELQVLHPGERAPIRASWMTGEISVRRRPDWLDVYAFEAGKLVGSRAKPAADSVPFGPGRAELDDGSRASVAAWAEWLRTNPEKRLHLSGMCAEDEQGACLELAGRRVMAVVRALDGLGVARRRLDLETRAQPYLEEAGSGGDKGAPNRRVRIEPWSGP